MTSISCSEVATLLVKWDRTEWVSWCLSNLAWSDGSVEVLSPQWTQQHITKTSFYVSNSKLQLTNIQIGPLCLDGNGITQASRRWRNKHYRRRCNNIGDKTNVDSPWGENKDYWRFKAVLWLQAHLLFLDQKKHS